MNYLSVTGFSSIQTNSIFFTTPFGVADIKYGILGAPFFKRCNQEINIQNLTMIFEHYFNDQPTTASSTALIKRILLLFSSVYQINSKKPFLKKPKLLHFQFFELKLQKLDGLKLKTMNYFSLKNL